MVRCLSRELIPGTASFFCRGTGNIFCFVIAAATTQFSLVAESSQRQFTSELEQTNGVVRGCCSPGQRLLAPGRLYTFMLEPPGLAVNVSLPTEFAVSLIIRCRQTVWWFTCHAGLLAWFKMKKPSPVSLPCVLQVWFGVPF